MLDLVPFARSRREMANGNGKVCFVRQLLQFQLPEPQPRTVAAAVVRRYQQALRFGIQGLTFMAPPASNGRHGKRSGVVIRPHVHESRVALQVIDAVGVRTGNVVPLDRDGLLREQPLLACVFVVSHSSFFLVSTEVTGVPFAKARLT